MQGLDPVPDSRTEVLPQPAHCLPSWHPLYYTEASPGNNLLQSRAHELNFETLTFGRTAKAVRKQSCALAYS